MTAQIAEVITQCQAIDTPGDTNRFEAEAQILAGGLNITAATAAGSFIITAVVAGSGGAPATVAWQYPFGNSSQYGSAMCGGASTCAVGAKATIPGSYTVPSGQVLIATEVTASVAPFMFSAKLISASNTVVHLDSLFLVRSANPMNLSKVTVNAANSTAQGCGS